MNLLTFNETMKILRLDPQKPTDKQKLYRLCFYHKIEYIKHGKRSFFTNEAIKRYIEKQTIKALA